VNTRVTPLGSTARRPYPGRSQRSTRLTVAEGALALTCCYGLIGAGAGAAAGATLVGLIAGLGIGLLAVAAILLVSGASISSREFTRSARIRRAGVPRQTRTVMTVGQRRRG
jgi:hypothetical protein